MGRGRICLVSRHIVEDSARGNLFAMRRIRSFVLWILRALLWIIVALLAQSALWADVPILLKTLVLATAVLSAWRPEYGLLAAAGLVPFGNTLAARLSPIPFNLSEGIVLAFLAGALFSARRREVGRPLDAVTASGLLFALVIVASCAVQLAIERAWQDHWDQFLVSFLRYLTFDYLTAQPDVRPWVFGTGFVPPAMLWLEGIGLVLISRTLCRESPALAGRLLKVAVVSAAGAAALSLARILDAAVKTGTSPWSILQSDVRWTAAIPSINPSGSYFAMTSLVALGLAWGARSGVVRGVWLVAAALISPAVWITKSRAGIIAWTAMLAAMLVRRVFSRRYVVPAVITVALATGAFILFVNPFGILRADPDGATVHARALLARGSLRMIADNPMFGVGIRQFRLRFGEYSPPEAKGYVEDDPHNHLLGFATEMGVIGLTAFLLFLGTGATAAVRLLRARADGPATGLSLGLAAMLITCVSHQPLAVPIVAFTFWILWGAVVAWGQQAPPPAVERPAFRRVALFAGALAAVAILVSIPIRARAAIDQIDMTKVEYGFHDWDINAHGTKFRWSSDHSTMFLSSEMSLVNLPIGASLGGTPNGVDVQILVEGEPAGRYFLTDEAWHDVRLVAPRNGRKFWRIDLRVSPTFVPKQLNPSVNDTRRLGIRVGEPVQREMR